MEIIEARAGSRDVDAAAQIWAETTAARDGDREVPGLAVSRPVIADVLARSGRSLLLIARDADGTAAGFAAVEPLGADQARAQLSYFGVRPGRWGQGVGERLLRALPDRLRAAGFSHAELLVYVGNCRATALYERLGWQPRGEPAAHPRTGKPEQRYELPL